jgi:hypothetical protein
MKTILQTLVVIVFSSSFLLAGCASTNGWNYPSDCCFYQEAQCGSCVKKVTCTQTKYVKTSCGACEMYPERSPCDASYRYACCDSRNYWIE